MPLKICYFGNFDPNYSRTKVLRNGLRSAGAEIIDCRSTKKGLRLYQDLFRQHKQISDYDLIFIGNGGPSVFLPFFAQCISSKPVVWEPLFSIYDNWIFDREVASRFSLKALYYFVMDWVGVKSANLIVLDTNSHHQYFIKTFGAKPNQLTTAYIGADTDIFSSDAVQSGNNPIRTFEVEFHGKYIPVQGTEVIVRAAAELREDVSIHFTLIGGGQTHRQTVALADELKLTNITFLPFQPPETIVQYIQNADVCLGLLGDVPRVHRAIPNKVYEAAALGKVSINADTAALREIFTPGKDVVVIPPGDHEALAKAIVQLKESGLVKTFGQRAHQTFCKRVNTQEIGIRLYAELQELVSEV